jgi:hypothetical protein
VVVGVFKILFWGLFWVVFLVWGLFVLLFGCGYFGFVCWWVVGFLVCMLFGCGLFGGLQLAMLVFGVLLLVVKQSGRQ